jgi:vancomycin resistance protein VanW
LRFLHDLFSGIKFAETAVFLPEPKFSIVLKQPIKVAHLYENKIENLKLAGSKINKILIKPGELFSFWRIVGNPTENNGYKKGRNIVSGVMAEEFGGGLCQLSGILYHLSLMAGLEIKERFNHSVDFYTDENRYTPIGCDATVVYGYKDLRIRNNYAFPIQFYVEIGNDQLIAVVKSQIPIVEKKILVEKRELEGRIEVCLMDETKELLSHSIYRKLTSHGN